MKNKQRLTALALATLMGLSAVGCGNEQGETQVAQNPSESQAQTSESTPATEPVDELSWLNTSGSLPLVEEGTEKTLSMAIRMQDDSPNPDEVWAYKFIEEVMNIDLEVTKFTNANKSEFTSLTFADTDLPDVIIGADLSTTDLIAYGANEGQIIDLAPYINEELTPNLYQIYQDNPEYLDAITDAEGHIWSLGRIADPADRGSVPRAFFDYDALEALKVEVPTTLDDLLDVLRTAKANDASSYPLGGSYSTHNPGLYILNALGYNTTDTNGMSIGLRNGKAVLPVADREAYGAYLTFMNTLYTEGLIHPDFYTMDGTTTKALVAEGKNIFYSQAPFAVLSNFNAWWGAMPLTSEYNDTPMWPVGTTSVTAGGFVITSSCEEVELAMAFADWIFGKTEVEGLYDDQYHYDLITSGPAEFQKDYLLDVVSGYSEDPVTGANRLYLDYENNKDSYANKNDYLYKKVQLIPNNIIGAPKPTDHSLDPDITKYANVADVRHSDELKGVGELTFRMGLQETVCKYTVPGFPSNVYMDSATMEHANNLLIVVREYAAQESAKFVTGARPLDELNAYFDEIEKLGALEYVKIYQDYYSSLQ